MISCKSFLLKHNGYVKFLNFYPIGNRGIGFSISNNFGNNLLDQIRNFKPFIVIMIESLEGVKNLNEILKVKNELLRENSFPDIIINNAAGNFLCPFENLSVNGWKRINDIVLNGAFNIYHIFGKEIIKQKRKTKNERKYKK